MEIKVRDLGEMESKSTQEIEKQLLEKHEAQQESLEKTSPSEEVQRVNLQEESQEEPKQEEVVEENLEEAAPATADANAKITIPEVYNEPICSG